MDKSSADGGKQAPDFLAGEMGALMRAHDWSSSPLGDLENWPLALRTSLNLILRARVPMFILWGPSLIYLYNDAVIPILGARHPQGLGRHFFDVWPEIQSEIEPVIYRVFGGEASFLENFSVLLERSGHYEQRWFTLSYSPIVDDSGAVAGALCVCTETTGNVLAERGHISERDRLRQMFEQAPGFIALLRGPDHVYELTNAAFRQLIGHREVIGKSVTEAGQENSFIKLLNKVYRSGSTITRVDTKIGLQLTPGGPVEYRYVDAVFQPISDKDGQIVGIFIQGSDVTPRVQAEAALRESEERLRLGMQVAGFGTFDYDLVTDGVYFSPDLRAIFGLSPDEPVTADRYISLIHPDDRELVAAARQGVRDPEGPEDFALEYRLIRPDGELRWLSLRVRVFIAGEGAARRALRVVGAVQDISERKRTEAALRESEERLRLGMQVAGFGTYDHDLVTDEVYFSRDLRAIFGLSPDEPVTADRYISLIHPDDREFVAAAQQAGYDSEGPEDFALEYRLLRPDGELRWLSLRARVFVAGEGAARRAVRTIAVIQDISERKRNQEREVLLMREVDHRAKNLLAVVMSVVQLTRAASTDDFVAAINGRVQALARAHTLIADSRWEGAELRTLVRAEMAPFGDERTRIVGPAVELKPAAAQTLALVLHELTTNAARYGALSAPAGRVKVGWAIDPLSRDLVLRWEEQGGPAVTAPTHRGFGVSIIAASLEHQLGGAVRLDWRPQGLVCELVLPGRHVALGESDAYTRLPLARAGSPSSAGVRVLVVEDEALIAMDLAHMLTSTGHIVVGPAGRVRTALDLLQGQRPDVALLDIDLGGTQSYPVADALVEQGVPFAFLTGFTAVVRPPRFATMPVLTKPAEPAAITRRIGELLAGKAA